ncbi:hypothetical protein [Mycobacterium canetti]|uniref:hypothetical protein n=1 Tax=Mycobacterium canetti TaxID=78331 RepID=UPI00399D5A8F
MLLTCGGVHRSGSCNSLTRVTSTPPPTTGQWTPTHPPAPRSSVWQAVGLAIALVLGAAALIVALTRPTAASGPAATVGTTATPTYTAAETAAAHQKLCEVYKLAARQVQIETNSDNPALASAAAVNGALMLEQSVNAAPALSPGDRAAAHALAEAYTNTNAIGSYVHSDDPVYQAAVDDVNAKDARMKALCDGG